MAERWPLRRIPRPACAKVSGEKGLVLTWAARSRVVVVSELSWVGVEISLSEDGLLEIVRARLGPILTFAILTPSPGPIHPHPQPSSVATPNHPTNPPNMSAPIKTLASIAAPTVAQQSEPVEAAPRQNAAEKAAVDRGLAETRVESIRIDGLVS